MDIDPRISMGSVGPGSQAQEVAGDPNLGKDEFVQLLMAQLAHQDPTEPQDSSAFVAQLAQFANVELAQEANAQLEALLMAQAANNQTATTQLVGKEILYMADEVTITEENTPEIVLEVSQPAQNVRVTLVDEDGNEFSMPAMSNVPAGRTSIVPMGPDGEPLEPGTYQIKVEADDGQGNGVNVVTAVRAHVDGVTFTEGFPQLLAGGIKLSLSDVIEVLDPTGGAPAGTDPFALTSSGGSSGTSDDTSGSSTSTADDGRIPVRQSPTTNTSAGRRADASTITVPVTQPPVRIPRNGLPFPYSSRGY